MEESKMRIEERVSLLKAMNTIMLNENDEDIINTWLDLGVPDNTSEEDYESIAEDDEAFIDICKEFMIFMIFMRNKDNKLFLGKIGEKFEVV